MLPQEQGSPQTWALGGRFLVGDASRAQRGLGQQALDLSDLAGAPPSSFRASRTQKPGRVEFQGLPWPLGLRTGAILPVGRGTS